MNCSPWLHGASFCAGPSSLTFVDPCTYCNHHKRAQEAAALEPLNVGQHALPRTYDGREMPYQMRATSCQNINKGQVPFPTSIKVKDLMR